MQNLVMLTDRGHPSAEAILIVVVNIPAGPTKWDRAKSTPEVSGRAGRLRSTTHDGDGTSGRIGIGVGWRMKSRCSVEGSCGRVIDVLVLHS